MQGLQLAVVISTIIIFILSVLLAALLTRKYMAKKSLPHLYWSIGMWLFAVGVLLEILFAFGIYSEFLIDAYLFIVAALVTSLSVGAILLVNNKKLHWAYYIFSIVMLIALAVSLATSTVGNILQSYVVFGNLPLWVTITSILVTFPASAVLIIVACIGYKRNHRLIGIIVGTIIVAVAGTLYIASVPEFLYFAEFAGILLLWLAFI